MTFSMADPARRCRLDVRIVIELAHRRALLDHERQALLDALDHDDCLRRGDQASARSTRSRHRRATGQGPPGGRG